MELFYRKYGTANKYIIILHGLYGASDNWVGIAKQLSNNYTVFIPDQRNHGQSPHSNDFNYKFLINDLNEFISKNKISNPIIIGHSMGGKVAMYFNYTFPNIVKKQIIIDIFPKDYTNNSTNNFHINTINFMKSLNLKTFKNRKEISEFVFNKINDKRLTHFFIKNLKLENNIFKWKINVDVISKEFNNIVSENYNKEMNNILTPSLFIKAQNSYYIDNNDIKNLKNIFKNYKFYQINESSHWVHSDKPKELINVIINFLKI